MAAESVGSVFLELRADATKMKGDIDKALGSASRSFKKFGSRLQSIGSKMTLGITAPIAAIGAGMVKSAAEFEKGMRNVNSLLNLPTVGLKKLSADIRKVSNDLGVDLVGQTEAAYQAISAGVKENDLGKFLTEASKDAIAGVASTTDAVAVLTKTMDAYGDKSVSVETLSDQLFATVKNGVTTFGELAAALPIVAGQAATLNVESKELLGLLARTTKVSPTTAVAVTRIASAMTAMSKPTKEMAGLLDKAGIKSVEASINAIGFVDTLIKITDAAGGSNTAIAKAFGSKEALLFVQDLTSNTDKFREQIEGVTNSLGARDKAFEENNKGMLRSLDILKAKMQSFATVAFLDSGVIDQITKFIGKVTELSGKLTDANPKFIQWGLAAAGVAAAIGPLVVGVGLMVSGIGGLLAIVGSVSSGMILAFVSLAGVVGALALAISKVPIGGMESDFAKLRKEEGLVVAVNEKLEETFWKVSKAMRLVKIGYADLIATSKEFRSGLIPPELSSIGAAFGIGDSSALTSEAAAARANVDRMIEGLKADDQRRERAAHKRGTDRTAANLRDLGAGMKGMIPFPGDLPNYDGPEDGLLASGGIDPAMQAALDAARAEAARLKREMEGVGNAVEGIPPMLERVNRELETMQPEPIGNSLAGMNDEMRRLQDQLQWMEIGSEAFTATQEKVDRLGFAIHQVGNTHESAFAKMQRKTEETAQSFQRLTNGLGQNLSQAFQTGEFKADSFLNTIKAHFADLAVENIKMMLGLQKGTGDGLSGMSKQFGGWFKWLTGAFSGIGSWIGKVLGGIGSTIGSIFSGGSSGGGGSSGAGWLSAIGSVVGMIFEGGGYTGDGSRTGGADGKGGFLAMMHPQETVIDHTKMTAPVATGGGGSNVTVNLTQNFDPSLTEPQVASMIEENGALTVAGIFEAFQSGGGARNILRGAI
jgi:TP901 family phage tail tape measure protein